MRSGQLTRARLLEVGASHARYAVLAAWVGDEWLDGVWLDGKVKSCNHEDLRLW